MQAVGSTLITHVGQSIVPWLGVGVPKPDDVNTEKQGKVEKIALNSYEALHASSAVPHRTGHSSQPA